jgi:hypothetical protein
MFEKAEVVRVITEMNGTRKTYFSVIYVKTSVVSIIIFMAIEYCFPFEISNIS